MSRRQADALLKHARAQTRLVNAERLGAVGRDLLLGRQYAIGRDDVCLGTGDPLAVIPFVVEAWAMKTDKPWINLEAFVNRTPITGQLETVRDASDKQINIFGCGLAHGISGTPTRGGYRIAFNLLTPYCPITSDGKAPNLAPFFDVIATVIAKATKKAQRAGANGARVSQKDVVLENLDAVIASVSGDREFRFNERQLFYQLRPIVREATGVELQIANFTGIITDYESEHGEIEGMYREPRGSIYHPHRRETIPLGSPARSTASTMPTPTAP